MAGTTLFTRLPEVAHAHTAFRLASCSLLTLLLTAPVMAGSVGAALTFQHATGVEQLTAADRDDIFRQPGVKAGHEPGTLAFTDDGCPPMQGAEVQGVDLNKDNYPEVLVSLGSTCMYGFAGSGVNLLMRDTGGHWKLQYLGAGIPVVQDTRHKGCVDLMIGGPGFCQPVLAWTGSSYKFDRNIPEQPGGCDNQ